jgi:predicted O-methyltransferase YrrM
MMLQKSTCGLGEKGKRIWAVARHFVPPKPRLYYEGRPPLEGQMWYRERKMLFQTIRRFKPIHCFEIGTWKGGGSTLFIAQALAENGKGMLHTIENNPEFRKQAEENFRKHLPDLFPFVDFRFGDYRQVFSEILNSAGRIDFLILDGPEDAQATLEQFWFFRPFMKPGALLMVHDWLTEKARLIRPILEDSNEWCLEKILLPPRSVGLAFTVKVR